MARPGRGSGQAHPAPGDDHERRPHARGVPPPGGLPLGDRRERRVGDQWTQHTAFYAVGVMMEALVRVGTQWVQKVEYGVHRAFREAFPSGMRYNPATAEHVPATLSKVADSAAKGLYLVTHTTPSTTNGRGSGSNALWRRSGYLDTTRLRYATAIR